VSDRFSVIVSTYRRPDSLKQTIASLREQSLAPAQIVVSAWEGDAETIAGVRSDPAITLVLSADNTITTKENAGIAAATGDILCFIDDDAVARPDWLRRIAVHYADPAVVAVGGRDAVHHPEGVDDRPADVVGRVRWFGRVTANHHLRAAGPRPVAFLKGCNMSFRRSALAGVDPDLEGEVPYGFEIDLGLSATRQGGRIVYDPEVLVDHYPSSDMNAHLPELARVLNHNQTYILLKHFGPVRRLAFLLYTFLVGDRDTIGLLRVPLLWGRPQWDRSVVRAHFGGKLAGMRTFLRHRA
jgi:GT2 family glycosyltransferase